MVRARSSKLIERSTGSSPGISRRERRKHEMRARILDAARELFSEQGFQETRIAEVCDRADIAQNGMHICWASFDEEAREEVRDEEVLGGHAVDVTTEDDT